MGEPFTAAREWWNANDRAILVFRARRDSDTRPQGGDVEQAPLASGAGRRQSP